MFQLESVLARKPRVQFPGAISHVVTRGDGRQLLFHDNRHYQRFTEGLEAEILRSSWQVIAFCWAALGDTHKPGAILSSLKPFSLERFLLLRQIVVNCFNSKEINSVHLIA